MFKTNLKDCKGYKFRIYPNKIQEERIINNFGCCRFIYNRALANRIDSYKESSITIKLFDQIKELPLLKEEYEWLKDADATSLQSVLKDLNNAYLNFFRRVRNGDKQVGFPKFKSKHNNRQSYTSNFTNNNIRIYDKHILIPKLGLVRVKISKQVIGRILSIVISKNPSGKYFVTIKICDSSNEPMKQTKKHIGVDLGIKSFLTTSDGLSYDSHKFLRKNEKKLARLQRQLSRKQKGSNNRNKARIKVARLHEKISNQRNDTLHKISHDLIKKYDIIFLEDLSISNMMKNRKLSKSISDCGWGEFCRQLYYKSEWYGKYVFNIDKYHPSSQLCNVCGSRNRSVVNLAIREWICNDCGTLLDRDINAAKNILKEGLKSICFIR